MSRGGKAHKWPPAATSHTRRAATAIDLCRPGVSGSAYVAIARKVRLHPVSVWRSLKLVTKTMPRPEPRSESLKL